MDYKLLLKNIKELRIEKKLSQADVAKELSLSREVYNRYEKGNRKISIEVLCDIAEFYKVTLDYICGREI